MTLLANPPIPHPSPARRMSLDEFMALPDNAGFELVEGVLAERKDMGALANYIIMQLGARLVSFCAGRGVGYVFASETTYRCFGHPDTGRRPDVSFIRKGRLKDERIPAGYLELPADLAVEVVSPNDLSCDVEEKVALYLRHGFDEVWVVFPNTQSVRVHPPGEPILNFSTEQALTGRGPLEGFSCPVRDLFPPPEPGPAAA